MRTTPDPDPHSGHAQRTPSEEHAWWARLDAWVTNLRRAHEHLWPPPAISSTHREGGRIRQHPWPECWQQRHPGLVELLDALRVWHSDLVRVPFTGQTARAFVDWHTTVQQALAQEVQVIAKYCAHGHRAPDAGPHTSRAHPAGKAHGPSSDLPGHPAPHHTAGRDARRPQREHTRRNPGDHPSSEGLT
jgi:hypothetical protein